MKHCRMCGVLVEDGCLMFADALRCETYQNRPGQVAPPQPLKSQESIVDVLARKKAEAAEQDTK